VEKEQDSPIPENKCPTIQMISQDQKLFPNHRTKNGFPKTYLISEIRILISVSDSKIDFRKLEKFPRIGFKNQFRI